MVKNSIKSALATSIILALVACTNTIPNNAPNVGDGSKPFHSIDNFQDLDKEYTFSTKELTRSYLERKLKTWLCINEGDISISESSCPNGAKLVKEINYAMYKHPDLFCAIINDQDNGGMLDLINAVAEVSIRKGIDPAFGAFLEGCSVPFSGEFQVNTFTTNSQANPSVAMDDTGDFVITWNSYNGQDGDQLGVFAQRYDSTGSPIGTEFQVNTFTTGNQAVPVIAMDSDGDFVISWYGFNPDYNNYDVFARRYDSNGNPAGSEFRVNTFTSGDKILPAIGMDDTGDFVIAWESQYQDSDNSKGIYARRYDSSGNPAGSEFRVNTYTAFTQENASVSVNSQGNFVIAWQSNIQDLSGFGVFAQKYDSSGNPDNSEFQVNTNNLGRQDLPAVALDDNNNFVIAWESFVQPDFESASFNTQVSNLTLGIYAQRFNSGGFLGSEFRVNSFTTNHQMQPSIATDSDGDFVISWNGYEQDGDGIYEGNIYSRRYNSDGSFGSEFRNNNFTTTAQCFQATAMDYDGDFVVTWQSKGQEVGGVSYEYGIYARRYDKNGDSQ
jgi:hypothetical protein